MSAAAPLFQISKGQQVKAVEMKTGKCLNLTVKKSDEYGATLEADDGSCIELSSYSSVIWKRGTLEFYD